MSQLSLVQNAQIQISLVNGQPTTTSLNIAKVFRKPHHVVLKSIRALIDVTPQNFRLDNFILTSYVDEQGKEQPMYILTQDGFTLLVMGYTGKKAMQFKIMYINEFNRMREALTKGHPLTLSSVTDRKALDVLVKVWAKERTMLFSSCWKQVHAHFQIASAKDLPTAWLPDAIAFVQSKIDAMPKELPPAMIKPLPKIPSELESKIITLKEKYFPELYKIRSLSMDMHRELRELAYVPYRSALNRINTKGQSAVTDYFVQTIYAEQYEIEDLAKELVSTAEHAVYTLLCVAKMQDL